MKTARIHVQQHIRRVLAWFVLSLAAGWLAPAMAGPAWLDASICSSSDAAGGDRAAGAAHQHLGCGMCAPVPTALPPSDPAVDFNTRLRFETHALACAACCGAQARPAQARGPPPSSN